jgi:excisionase family DNA binding protein
MNDPNLLLSPVELELLANQVAERVSDMLSHRTRLVDRHELAKILGVSLPTLDRQLRNKNVPRVRIGRRLQFDPTEVIAFFSNTKLDIVQVSR